MKNISINLSDLKSKVDKLDIDKLVSVPVDLSKLSDVVKNNVVKKDVYNAKIKNTDDKIRSITNLATTTALTTVENKVTLNVSNLVKKTDTNTKLTETENKSTTDHDYDIYITTQEFNKLTLTNFVKKTDVDNKLKKLSKDVSSNKRKHVLVEMDYQEKFKQ